MSTNKISNPYSQVAINRVKSLALKIEGAESVAHIFPRAYCIAKPAPGCAVFVTPWMDAEPQVRTPQFSASQLIRDGAEDVKVGDWCSLAYVSTPGIGSLRVIERLS